MRLKPSTAWVIAGMLNKNAKHQSWCGIPGFYCLRTAPVLVFHDRRMQILIQRGAARYPQ